MTHTARTEESTMTAVTVAFVVTASGKAVSVYPTRKRAESMAERIGGEVVERPVYTGEVATFTFHGHMRRGVVVGGKGAAVEVEFAQGTTGRVVKRIPVEKVSF